MKTPNFDLWPLHVCNMCVHMYDCMYTYTKNLPFQTGPCKLTLVLWASRLKPSSSNQAHAVAESSSTQSQGGQETWSCSPEIPPLLLCLSQASGTIVGRHSFFSDSSPQHLAWPGCPALGSLRSVSCFLPSYSGLGPSDLLCPQGHL